VAPSDPLGTVDSVNPLAEEVAERVDGVLTQFLGERTWQLSVVGPELADVAVSARAAVLEGGKRLRPRFAYWGWRAVRGADDDDSALITAAAALELLHGSALVHDDLMDGSETRRGKPAPHRTFASLHARECWRGNDSRFGAAASILLGDLLLTWSDTLFARAALPEATRRVFDDMRQFVVAGQYLDMLVQARGGFDCADALRVARFKTANYTVEGPLHVGATAAGAPPEVLRALSAYAAPLGEAFQLRDDLLGVFGDPDETGKPAGDDLREGKRTLLVGLAMRAATADERRRLACRLGCRDLDEAGVAELRAILVDTGAVAEVERRIVQRTEDARIALDTSTLSEDSVKALDVLAVAATQRRC
jgi:geranylgeranyl diphosphate synthase type I